MRPEYIMLPMNLKTHKQASPNAKVSIASKMRHLVHNALFRPTTFGSKRCAKALARFFRRDCGAGISYRSSGNSVSVTVVAFFSTSFPGLSSNLIVIDFLRFSVDEEAMIWSCDLRAYNRCYE
jgi:hypothetical protein